jgi:hypothetical protein
LPLTPQRFKPTPPDQEQPALFLRSDLAFFFI